MKRLAAFVVGLALLALGALNPALAQTVPVSMSWTNPTASVDGVPLTGANALTGIEVHWATAPIADNALTRAAQVTLGLVAATTQQVAVSNGSTLYARVRALSAGGKSAYSNQASKLITLSTVPLPPTDLQMVITVSHNADGSVVVALLVDEARERTIYNGG